MSLFRRKNKNICVPLAGKEFKLFCSVLKTEIDNLEPKVCLNAKESTIYSVAKRYYSTCLFEGVSNVLVLTFEPHDRSDMLTLIVMVMLAYDSEKDLNNKATLKNIAEKIQKAHKGLGD